MKEKILLLVGCSNTAGSEIDGTQDSAYNRKMSYGSRLTDQGRIFSDYKPINIAICGSPNDFIVTTLLMWFKEEYDPELMDVFVLLGWADSARMCSPFSRPTHYDQMNPHADWYSDVLSYYLTVNTGWIPPHDDEKAVTTQFVNFMANNLEYLEVANMNKSLQVQYFLKSKHIPYLMVNTLHMFSQDNEFLFPYLDLVDSDRYYKFFDSDESFFPKYQNLGYINKKAKWFHHNEEPHYLYSLELEKHISDKRLHDISVQ